MLKKHILLAAGILLTPYLAAQDVAVSKVAGNGSDDYYMEANTGSMVAYSMGSTSCNVGNVVINWTPSNKQAPVIQTTMFRIKDSRIEQLGYGWLKDSFCAVSENSCGPCQATPCSNLGLGCADTYGSGLNDGASGVAKFQVNPTTGTWPAGGWITASGSLPLRGRIQFPTADAANPGATYIGEVLYISEHDQLAGNARNNASWHEFEFVNGSLSNLDNVGSIHMFDPAIFAWKNEHSDVNITEVVNVNEGGSGVHGYVFVGSKATDIGGGTWRYDYAVQNFNSDAGISSLELPNMNSSVSNMYYKDVDHHSGSIWANTDWNMTSGGNAPTWTCPQTFAQNPNASALRWGFMATFSFETDAPPASAMASANLGLFKTGGTLAADVIVPDNNACTGGSITPYCSANANSAFASGAQFSISGTPNVTTNDLTLTVSSLPPNQIGYWLMAPNQAFVPFFSGSQGNLCLGAGGVRWNEPQYVQWSGAFGFAQMSPDLSTGPYGTPINDGDTWNFQFWYRDINPSNTSNTSAAVEVVFCQ